MRPDDVDVIVEGGGPKAIVMIHGWLDAPAVGRYTLRPITFHSRAWAERVAAAPGNRVIAFPTGHRIMVELPAEFNAVLLERLTKPDRQA